MQANGEGVALVPTMGSLHAGHLALVRRARELAPRVVVSIFVNPLQFGAGEDLDVYPRDLERDLAQVREVGADVVFAPATEAMYPDGPSLTRVVVPEMGQVLCGRTRPHHFEGVATVVSKLFHIVEPDVAIFGEKDWQQLAIIRRMIRDLNLEVAVVGVETVREASGLALSSRNRYLSASDRARAEAIPEALDRARELWLQGEDRKIVLENRVREILYGKSLVPEYIECVDPDRLSPAPDELGAGPWRLALAVRVGTTRLIDNLRLERSPL